MFDTLNGFMYMGKPVHDDDNPDAEPNAGTVVPKPPPK